MAGSVKWQVYTADDDTEYAVLLDESNGLATGYRDFVDGDAGVIPLFPRYTKMRYVNLRSASGSRQLYIGDRTNGLYTGATTTIVLNGITYNVGSAIGEKGRRPFALDTGIDDGTAT